MVEGKDLTLVSCSFTFTQLPSHEINKLKCNKNLKRVPQDHPKLITSCLNILWDNHCSAHHPCLLVSSYQILLFFSGKFSHYVVGNCLASVGPTFSMEDNLGVGATSEYFNSLVWLPLLFWSSIDFLSDSGRLVQLYLSTSQAQIFLCCHVSSFKFILIYKFLKLISPSIELVYPTISLLMLFTVETITSFLFMMPM